MSFVHLHVHSEYSLLDGLSRIPQLVKRVKVLGQPAVALTDHGAMFGVIEFYRAAQKAGVKPIVGLEAYLARRSRHDRNPKKDKSPSHLLLLAQNDTGYKNLLKLTSLSQLEGFYYKPRIDRDLLARYSEGVICATACGSGEIPRLIRDGRLEVARQAVEWYMDVFGPERFLIELQWHEGIPNLKEINQQLIHFAHKYGLMMVATNDVHYVLAEEAEAQDVLLCIGTNSLVSQPDRMRMTDNSYYLKSADEMAALFGSEVPEALTNTLAVAEMCEVDLSMKGYHLPDFPLPESHTAESYLRHLCEEGLRRRYGERAGEPEIRQRLDYELSVIHEMGFDTYFLIVWDLTHYAEKRGIWYNARGSAAGSVVAYALGITRVNPFENNLIFERFLNPGRISMPDIDLDFPDDRRGEMIEYTVQKYGQDKVAQIITFGTLGARAAVRDVGRAMDIPLNEVDRVAKLIPAIPGKPVSIAEAIEQVPELKQVYEDTPYIRGLLDTAQQLEGVARHASTHAAGVIVSDLPLVEYAPLHRPTKDAESSLGAVTQFDMNVCEAIGLLKVDFLGLSTLTIMQKTCDLIRQHHGLELDLDTIPVDDPQAFDLLSRGDVAGVFQVEGQGMRRVLMDMKPTRFEHIVAAISLFRPGPLEYIPTYIHRMHGEEKVSYKHPKLEPILDETFGICVYQEQIIQIASQLAGYAPGDADQIRKAVGKKIKAKIDEHRSRFIAGAVDKGIPQETAISIYDDIEYFARYGFNKAHASAYAMITCQTAYLKAHYPVEYMTALLTVERHNTEKIGFLATECRRMGIEVLPPSVNESELEFSLEREASSQALSEAQGVAPISTRSVQSPREAFNLQPIRFGLGAIKNVGDGPVQAIVEARAKGGPFHSLDDFCRRVDLRVVNRRALESLVRTGVLDEFGHRAQLLAVIDRMVGLSAHTHRAREMGQMTLFGDAMAMPDDASMISPLPQVEEAPHREMLVWERELAGVYLSAHPLTRVMADLHDVISVMCGQITEDMGNQKVIVAGMVTYVRRLTTKRGDPMAFAGLEDLSGLIEIVIFPRVWEKTQELWEMDKILVVRGRVDARGRQPKVLAESVTDNFTHTRPVGEGEHAPGQPTVSRGPASQERAVVAQEAVVDYTPPPPEEPPWEIDPSSVQSEAEAGPVVERQVEDGAQAQRRGAPGGAPQEGTPPPVPEPGIAPTASMGRAPQHVLVTLQRSGDEQLDIARLRQAHQLLTDCQGGNDRFSLLLVGGSNAKIQLDFPNHFTNYSPELKARLERLLGAGCVRLIESVDHSRGSAKERIVYETI